MIVTDGVFSMDGTVAPLPALLELAGRHDAFVMLDDSHATGVLGPNGEGRSSTSASRAACPVLMGTLGKALGSIGGFIAGSRDLIDYLAGSARSFLFTTSMTPASAAAALAGLRILRAEPELVGRLWANARRLHEGFERLGLRTLPEPAPILPVFLDDDGAAAALSRRLYELGVVVQPVGAPYVPAGSSRLRVIATAAHSPGAPRRGARRLRRGGPGPRLTAGQEGVLITSHRSMTAPELTGQGGGGVPAVTGAPPPASRPPHGGGAAERRAGPRGGRVARGRRRHRRRRRRGLLRVLPRARRPVGPRARARPDLLGQLVGNSGLVTTSSCTPEAAPGVIGQALRWLLEPQGPFRLPAPHRRGLPALAVAVPCTVHAGGGRAQHALPA